MNLNLLAGIAAIALFAGYFIPMVIKLKDIPLAIVVLGGILMVVVDAWESLADKDR